MNLAAEKILGRTPDDLMGKTSEQEEHHTIRPDGSLFPGKEHPSMVALQTGRQVQNVVMGIFNPQQQQRRWISISAVPVFQNGESPPHQVYALFNDITEGRLLLEKIRFSEERYRSLTEATPDGVYMLDRDFIYQYVNPIICQWWGKTADEMVEHAAV